MSKIKLPDFYINLELLKFILNHLNYVLYFQQLLEDLFFLKILFSIKNVNFTVFHVLFSG